MSGKSVIVVVVLLVGITSVLRHQLDHAESGHAEGAVRGELWSGDVHDQLLMKLRVAA